MHAFLLFLPPVLIDLTYFARRCIYPFLGTCLRIHNLHQPYIRHLGFQIIVHLQCHNIVLPIGDGQGVVVIPDIDKVGDHKGGTPFFDDIGQIFERHAHIGFRTLGLEVDEFADNVQNMFFPFFGRNKLFYFIGEEYHPDFIIILNRRKSQRGSNLGHHIALDGLACTEILTGGNVYQQHHGEFALFFKNLHKRFVVAGGHIPVDIAYIVAILVFAHFGESHPPTFEGRVILPREDVT